MARQDPPGPGADGDSEQAATEPPVPAAPPPPPHIPAAPPPTPGGTPYDPSKAALSAAPPTVSWAPPSEPRAGAPVPGAPGLVFADTLPRFLAYVLDGILIGIVAAMVYGPLGVYAERPSDLSIAGSTVVAVGLQFLYFVGLWTSGARATLGMRLFRIQVGNAFDGRCLSIAQAVRRWVGLGVPLSLLGMAPALVSLGATLQALWALVLLISVVRSPTRQGVHDRFANSALVQPAGDRGPVMACLLLFLVLIVLPLVGVVMLVFLGSQVADILSGVGSSI